MVTEWLTRRTRLDAARAISTLCGDTVPSGRRQKIRTQAGGERSEHVNLSSAFVLGTVGAQGGARAQERFGFNDTTNCVSPRGRQSWADLCSAGAEAPARLARTVRYTTIMQGLTAP